MSRAGSASPQDLTGAAVLELHVAELQQLFDKMDPALFRERDLEPHAREYIVDWARETRSGELLALVVRLGREPVTADNAAMVRDAVNNFFRRRALCTRRELRRLFRTGRISLLIGLLFVAVAIIVGESIGALISRERVARLVQESLVIGGWVALWRPIEIFLYDWWPIRDEARLYDRLGEMEVSLLGARNAASREEESHAS
jgi:hypothetical protein